MANLVVCCDGTWNTADQTEGGVPTPTNVVRLFNLVAERDKSGAEQKKYYHPGVGTGGGLADKALGGGLGLGLDRNIQSGYRWLCDNYSKGDRIYLFGFSRGAYTARSLGGFVTRFGLLDASGLGEKTVWSRVEELFRKGYRVKGKSRKNWTDKGWAFTKSEAGEDGHDIPIHFIGVWDTVGALGIPDHLGVLNLLEEPGKYKFHDTELNKLVEHGRHAIALDEMRESFEPTLWTKTEGRDVQQVWFPGVHSDIGGGYREVGLSDGALNWMIGEAEGKGLAVDPELKKQIRADHLDRLHDSLSDFFRFLPSKPRGIPPLDADDNQALHRSAVARCRTPPLTQTPYRTTKRLAVGGSATIPIFAASPWNPTGLLLEAGAEYKFSAKGEWLDRTISCGPAGTKDGKFQPAEVVHVVSSLFGEAETLFRRMSGSENADFWFTKRHEKFPWFALVGVIANGQPDGDKPARHDELLIGNGIDKFKVARSGYLYGYANDAWNFYDNNRGSVSLTVTRLT